MSYWNNKRVIVTGGAGFLGSHVIEKLEAEGCENIFVVRSADYDLKKESDVARLFEDLARGKDGWAGSQLGRPADVLVHLAGLVGGIGANKASPAEYFYENLMMGVLTFHYAWKNSLEKFVAAGAGCGYPEHAPIPLKETSFWDGRPQYVSSPYSLAKRMLLVQSDAYWRQYQFPSVIAVPGNIYGPHDNFDLENAHVVPALVRKFVEAVDDGVSEIEVWGTGTPTRDFVYAGDVAEGMLRAGGLYQGSEVVNMSAGIDTSISQVVDTLVGISGFGGDIKWNTDRPDGQSRRLFDMSKARDDLGFEARTSLRDGLQITFDWYRENRNVARNVA